jgi:CHAT domain-containing protein
LVLLAYHIVGEEIMTFVIVEHEIRIVRNLGQVAAVASHLERLNTELDYFRADSEFVGRQMALLEQSTREVLVSLNNVLVAPVEVLLEEKDIRTSGRAGAPGKLVVVPHGLLLHQVPFHALFDGERYLLERFEISYAPSAQVYILCQEKASQQSG